MRFMMTCCALLFLTACPEKPKDDGELPETTGPTIGPSAGGPEAGPPLPDGERPNNAHFEVAEGEGVTLSGLISYEGEQKGALRMDFLTVAENAHPNLVHATSLDALGAFSIEVPKDFGALHLVAFIDVAGDGPSPTDPAATVKVAVGTDDISDITLALSDEPDLGELTPGGPPEGEPGPGVGAVEGEPADMQPAEGAPPPEGAPPEGAPPEGAPPAEGAPPEGAAEGAGGG